MLAGCFAIFAGNDTSEIPIARRRQIRRAPDLAAGSLRSDG
jgi:hypothetical protein